jgi:hypothetical protein
MAKIATLEKDIAQVLKEGKKLDTYLLSRFGTNVAMKLQRQLERRTPTARTTPTIRASEIGMADSCSRKLWYTYHEPEKAEGMHSDSIMKFLYGDIIEEAVLTLAKAAGHTVEKEQDQVKFALGHYTVVGHIDAVIDGVLIDVKSTTPYGMKDFEAGRGGDKFGYRAQLNVYAVGTGIKEKAWLAVDKQAGAIKLFPETKKYDTYDLFDRAVNALGKTSDDQLAHRAVVAEGTSGNLKLDIECSYCSFKKHCWRAANAGAGLRGFAYGTGPVWLAHVAREPKVPEIKV